MFQSSTPKLIPYFTQKFHLNFIIFRNNLHGSRRSVAATPSNPSSANNNQDSKGTTLTKIKDLTKNLRKNSKDDQSENDSRAGNGNGNHSSTPSRAVAPRNSLSMFSAERKGMSNLNNSKSSINSSTRSLQKDSPKTTRRATTSTLGKSYSKALSSCNNMIF